MQSTHSCAATCTGPVRHDAEREHDSMSETQHAAQQSQRAGRRRRHTLAALTAAITRQQQQQQQAHPSAQQHASAAVPPAAPSVGAIAMPSVLQPIYGSAAISPPALLSALLQYATQHSLINTIDRTHLRLNSTLQQIISHYHALKGQTYRPTGETIQLSTLYSMITTLLYTSKHPATPLSYTPHTVPSTAYVQSERIDATVKEAQKSEQKTASQHTLVAKERSPVAVESEQPTVEPVTDTSPAIPAHLHKYYISLFRQLCRRRYRCTVKFVPASGSKAGAYRYDVEFTPARIHAHLTSLFTPDIEVQEACFLTRELAQAAIASAWHRLLASDSEAEELHALERLAEEDAQQQTTESSSVSSQSSESSSVQSNATTVTTGAVAAQSSAAIPTDSASVTVLTPSHSYFTRYRALCTYNTATALKQLSWPINPAFIYTRTQQDTTLSWLVPAGCYGATHLYPELHSKLQAYLHKPGAVWNESQLESIRLDTLIQRTAARSKQYAVYGKSMALAYHSEGRDILTIATAYDIPPLQALRHIFATGAADLTQFVLPLSAVAPPYGYNSELIRHLLQHPLEAVAKGMLSQRDVQQIELAARHDIVTPVSIHRSSTEGYEGDVQRLVQQLGVKVKLEQELAEEQTRLFG